MNKLLAAAAVGLIVVCLIAPAVPFASVASPIPIGVALAVLTLGLLCTGVAYLLYFRLIHDVGPASALTVAFLIPVFGVLWGVIFLHEPVTPALVLGGLCVIAGTAMSTGFRFASLRFAGEHTSYGFIGYMEGALSSGVRVAKDLIRQHAGK